MKKLFNKAEAIVTEKHKNQRYYVKGEYVPYYYHLKFVQDIIDKNVDDSNPNKTSLKMIALFHDLLEDTDYTYEEMKKDFGDYVANGVKALTKNENLPYSDRLKDSLKRIMDFSEEVGAVKMADRICNLQDIDPKWNKDKCLSYLTDSKQIYDRLKSSNDKIAALLLYYIKNYEEKIKEM